MTRTPDDHQTVIGASEIPREVLCDNHMVVGHDSFDGRDYIFPGEILRDQIGHSLEVWGWNGDDKRVGHAAGFIDIVGKIYALDVEGHIREINRIVTVSYEVIYTVAPVHIPHDAVTVAHQQLGECRCPAATSDYRYFA